MLSIKEVLLHQVQLVNVELVKMNIEKNENVSLEELRNNPLKIKTNIWSKIKSDKEACMYLHLKAEFEQQENGLFEIDIVYKGTCKVHDSSDITKNDLETFFEYQSIRMLWPYLRETLTNTMLKMDVEPIKLPTVDVLKTLESTLESDENTDEDVTGK